MRRLSADASGGLRWDEFRFVDGGWLVESGWLFWDKLRGRLYGFSILVRDGVDEMRWLGGTYKQLRCGAVLLYAGWMNSDGWFGSDCLVATAHKLF